MHGQWLAVKGGSIRKIWCASCSLGALLVVTRVALSVAKLDHKYTTNNDRLSCLVLVNKNAEDRVRLLH